MTVNIQIGGENLSRIQTQGTLQQHLLKPSECSLHNRVVIEQALTDQQARIPTDFRQAFLDFQYQQQHFFASYQLHCPIGYAHLLFCRLFYYTRCVLPICGTTLRLCRNFLNGLFLLISV